ncbi:IS3 family transposase [Cuniculiplasma sp. SKW3]|uniref:IS3 family transposase n=1 Tax=Cuniculiplasma sp. SKW3 TaxID=3400170 RepID=UPI003FD67682
MNFTLDEIIRISGERTTYGYRRVWALLRNSGIRVNIKTVRRIMRRNSLALPLQNIRTELGRRNSQSRTTSTGYGKQTSTM